MEIVLDKKILMVVIKSGLKNSVLSKFCSILTLIYVWSTRSHFLKFSQKLIGQAVIVKIRTLVTSDFFRKNFGLFEGGKNRLLRPLRYTQKSNQKVRNIFRDHGPIQFIFCYTRRETRFQFKTLIKSCWWYM